MVLIHTRSTDETTTDIIQWLLHCNKSFHRLNSIQDLVTEKAPAFDSFYFNGRSNLVPPVCANDSELDAPIHQYLDQQANEYIEALFFSLQTRCFGNNPFAGKGVNKLIALKIAEESGFEVPLTAVVATKSRLKECKEAWGRIITKSMHNGISITTASYLISGQRTEEVTDVMIESLNVSFFPSLIQQLVQKRHEVRVFYFNGFIRSLATFSSASEIAVDGRHTKRPRMIPFNLPPDIAGKLKVLMNRLDLNYGSVDLLYTPEGQFVFLEVNPYGQYGYLSKSGNYHLEKYIAEYL